MNARRPDFIIAGAARSGTTWLYHLLDRHPEIYMAKPIKPEPKFFLVDELYNRGIEYYADTLFADTGSATIAGEKSTNYLESRDAAARIHKHLPAVKLIFMLREPVARAYSNYLWSRMNAREDKDFATALALEERRERSLPVELRFVRPNAYFSRGLYADLLRPYFERFSRSQILCLKCEWIVCDASAIAARVHRFLGVAERPADAENLGPINVSAKQGEVLSDRVRQELLKRYEEPNRRLAELLGPDFDGWTT